MQGTYLILNKENAGFLAFTQCAGGELNPHVLRHMALNHACLPIPAPAQLISYYNRQ